MHGNCTTAGEPVKLLAPLSPEDEIRALNAYVDQLERALRYAREDRDMYQRSYSNLLEAVL